MKHARPPHLALALAAIWGCGGAQSPPPATAPSTPASSAVKTPPAPDETATGQPAKGEEPPSGGCPRGMVAVAGGTLWLGSPAKSGREDEHPETKTEVSALCADAHEVTVSEFSTCEKNKACPPLPREVHLLSPVSTGEQEALSHLCSARLPGNADLPANCVSQKEAARYCAWKGERLPTETEWEWMATGGDDQLPWPWGTALPSDANVCWQRQHGPCAVGSKPAGAFEVFDMAGNVAEWTSSTYGPYGKAGDPGKIVIRGGSWESTKEAELSPKRRAWREPDYRDVTLGFRCVLGR